MINQTSGTKTNFNRPSSLLFPEQANPTKTEEAPAAGQVKSALRTRTVRRSAHTFQVPTMSNLQQEAAHAAVEASANSSPQKAKKRRARREPAVLTDDLRLKRLHEEFKAHYVQPPINQIPYNKNMARKFDSTTDETEAVRRRRKRQAEASMVCRDRIKFVNEFVRMEQERLESELHASIQELLEAENAMNAIYKKTKKPVVSWKDYWNDN